MAAEVLLSTASQATSSLPQVGYLRTVVSCKRFNEPTLPTTLEEVNGLNYRVL
jgi:hypothetical protein